MLNISLQEKIGDLMGAIINLRTHRGDPNILNDIKNCLNAIFTNGGDAPVCRQVLYTNNTDKLFFGIIVMPNIEANDVVKMFISNERFTIPQVWVELDSKLFEDDLGLTNNEITALILREVSHIVADSRPVEEVKAEIDSYLLRTASTIKLSDSVHYKELLSFGVRDAIRKITSIFELPMDADPTDQFDRDMEINIDIKAAMDKIRKSGINPNSEIDNKIIFLGWVLRLYKDVLSNRIPAIHYLNTMIKLTPSQIEAREFKTIIERLKRIDDDSLIREGVFDSLVDSISKMRFDMKRNGIKKYENDYYEIQFECNNLETQEDAMLMLHRINSRMAVLEDYLTSEELTKADYARWSGLYRKYAELRAELSKNKIYQNKTRVYVNYGMDD